MIAVRHQWRPAKIVGRCQWQTIHSRSGSTASHLKHDPLRILFCGADEFSIASLNALQSLRSTRPDVVTSIDVVCRPDKAVGRGLKQKQSVPIKSVASQLGLPIHEVDSFRDWVAPADINLIVAVSFGLLVPARILNAARYGGLNVHPSLLPDLRGAAPIQHTLLRRYTHTGVSLQTMHATKFDHGRIVSQTTRPGIPIAPESTPHDLIKLLAPIGATMLTQALKDGEIAQPPKSNATTVPSVPSSYAPKITPDDRHIDWQTWTADEIILRDRVLGGLWDTTTFALCSNQSATTLPSKRITFTGPWSLTNASAGANRNGSPPSIAIPLGNQSTPRLGLRTIDGAVVVPNTVTIEGEPRHKGQHKLWAYLSRQSRDGNS